MHSTVTTVLYVLAMVTIMIIVDVRFLRHNLRLRLVANVVIVLAFAAFYAANVKRP